MWIEGPKHLYHHLLYHHLSRHTRTCQHCKQQLTPLPHNISFSNHVWMSNMKTGRGVPSSKGNGSNFGFFLAQVHSEWDGHAEENKLQTAKNAYAGPSGVNPVPPQSSQPLVNTQRELCLNVDAWQNSMTTCQREHLYPPRTMHILSFCPEKYFEGFIFNCYV